MRQVNRHTVGHRHGQQHTTQLGDVSVLTRLNQYPLELTRVHFNRAAVQLVAYYDPVETVCHRVA
jgi:hypothetical protein